MIAKPQPGAELGARPENDHGHAAAEEFVIHLGAGLHARRWRDEEPVHPARKQAAEALLFAGRVVVRVHEQHREAVLEGPFLDRHHHAREDGVRLRGQHEAEQARAARAQAGRGGVGHVAHLGGHVLNALLRRDGDVLRVTQGFRDGHHGDAGPVGDVFQSNHSTNAASNGSVTICREGEACHSATKRKG